MLEIKHMYKNFIRKAELTMTKEQTLILLKQCSNLYENMRLFTQKQKKIEQSYRNHCNKKTKLKSPSAGTFFLIFLITLSILCIVTSPWLSRPSRMPTYRGRVINVELARDLYERQVAGEELNSAQAGLVRQYQTRLAHNEAIRVAFGVFLANLITSVILAILLTLNKKNKIVKKNKIIDEENYRISSENEAINKQNIELYYQEESIVNQMLGIRQTYLEEVLPLLPPDYAYPDAVNYFIRLFENHRANNLTEAVNLYEVDLHRRRMEAGQQQMIAEQRRMVKQQMIGNAINLSNLAVNIANNHAIRDGFAQTQNAVNNNTEVIRQGLAKRGINVNNSMKELI